MSDVALKGDELKKLLKVAKKRPIAFAYSPGKSAAEDIFSMDRKKNPEVVARAVRKEAEGTKFAFGTGSVQGKVISLQCERQLPGMSKKLKKFFKAEKCPMNVVILDENGEVLEEDIEDLPDDGLLDDIDGEDDFDTDDTQDESAPEETTETSETEQDTTTDDEARRKAVSAMASEIKAGIAALKPEEQKALSKTFVGGVKSLQAGEFDQAEETFGKLKDVMDKLAGAAAAAPPPPPPPPPGNPAMARLQGAATSLAGRIDKLEDSAEKTKLLAALERLKTQIGDEDITGAAGTAKALGEAITKVSGQQSQAAKAVREQVRDENTEDEPVVDHTASEDGKGWSDARADMEATVLALLDKEMGDTGKMRAAWAFFIENGNKQKYADAMKAQPGLLKLIADAENAEMSAAEKDIPDNVVPFVRARLGWIKARNQLRGEMGKLQNAILAACKGDEFEGIADDTKELFTYLDVLDDKLENALEALVEAPDGDKRESLKRDAQKVLFDFQSELESPFFKDVDTNNGFAAVSVRGTAVSALADVNAALS